MVRVLEKYLPAYLKPGLMQADSLPDWNYDSWRVESFRAFLENRTRREALATLPWQGVVNLDATDAAVAEFFRANPLPKDRRPESVRFWVRWRGRLLGMPLMGAALQRIQPALRRWKSPRVKAAAHPFKLILRLAQLRLLQECIEAGDFGGTTACDPARTGKPVIARAQ